MSKSIYFLLAAVALIALIQIVRIAVRRHLVVKPGTARNWRERVLLRYQRLPALRRLATFAWVFAFFKLWLDPMFEELPEILASGKKLQTALDVGCGFGVAGCALLEWCNGLTLYGVDPSEVRVRVASAVLAPQGKAWRASAPDFVDPRLPQKLDAVFMLDMIHYLADEALDLTLKRIFERLDEDGILVLRSVVKPDGAGSVFWKAARWRGKLQNSHVHHRPAEQIRRAIEQAGFSLEREQISGANEELRWFIARPPRRSDAGSAAPTSPQR